MIDIETNRRLELSTDGDGGPYLMVPLDQLEEVRTVLQRNAVAYAVAEDAIGLDDHPVIAIIDFGIDADAHRIQEILDAA